MSEGIEISSRPQPVQGAGIYDDDDDGAGVFVSREWAERTRRSSDTAIPRPPPVLPAFDMIKGRRLSSVPLGLKPEQGSDVVISFQESFTEPEPFTKTKSCLKIDTDLESQQEKRSKRKISFWDGAKSLTPLGSRRKSSIRLDEEAQPHELQNLQDDVGSSSSSLDRDNVHAPLQKSRIVGVNHNDVLVDILGRPISREHWENSRGLGAYELEFDDISAPRRKQPPASALPGIPAPRRAPTLEEIEARKEVNSAFSVVAAFYALFGAGALVLVLCGGACMATGGSGPTCGSGLGGGVAMLVMGAFIAFRLFVVWRKYLRMSGGSRGASQRLRAARYTHRDSADGL